MFERVKGHEPAMAGHEEKDHVLGDYAAFLKALLPQAQGFICHDRHGRVFWSESPPDGSPAITDAYRATLTSVLCGQPLPADGARLPLARNIAYIVRLEGAARRPLGALTVLVDRSAANMPYQFVVDLLGHPARSLPSRVEIRPARPQKKG
jgi:hypothetical protein